MPGTTEPEEPVLSLDVWCEEAVAQANLAHQQFVGVSGCCDEVLLRIS
jgi:hypothetical protein